MRVEFNQGVPDNCVEWLWDNVGPGNLVPGKHKDTSFNEYAWFYERIAIMPDYSARHPDDIRYVPTITIKDPELATFFSLRWL